MTFQVAMIGSDGWVLASDRQTINAEHEERTTTSGPKIEYYPDYDLVFCSAGDRLGRFAANLLVDEISKLAAARDDPDDMLRAIGNRVFDVLSHRDAWTQTRQLIVALPSRGKKLHQLSLLRTLEPIWSVTGGDHRGQGFGMSVVTKHDGKVFGGDPSAGRLLSQIFYERLPVADLKKLAAFSVLLGHEINPAAVAGLDIFVATEARTGLLEPEELGDLEAEFPRVKNKLKSAVFGKRPSRKAR